MPRNSQQENDAITWQTVPVPLGSAGLDLRTPTAPNALTKLLNARFRDDRTIERRNGYVSLDVQDADSFSPGVNTPTGWVYGHGQLLDSGDGHYPLARRGQGVFRHDNNSIVWTGDRLLVMNEDGNPAIGASEFWGRGTGGLKRGIPAYLPVQTDTAPPDVVTGEYVETCITDTLRVVVASTDTNDLIAWVIDRTTGAVLDRTEIVADGNNIYEPRVVNSGGTPVCLWLDGTDLFISRWSGGLWSSPSPVRDAVTTFEVVTTDRGFVLCYQSGGSAYIGEYSTYHVVQDRFTFHTELTLSATCAGAMAFTASDDGMALVYQDAATLHLHATLFDDAGSGERHIELDSTAGPYDGGLACCYRGLAGNPVSTNLVVHAGNGGLYTKIFEIEDGLTPTIVQQTTRYRTFLASKSFRVGDEVFCWLFARNSETNYLAAGVTALQVCGICDREEAKSRTVRDTGDPGFGVRTLPYIQTDPNDEYRLTWIRPYTTSRVITIDDNTQTVADLYNRPGNCRIGDLSFLPALSAATYGESVYLAGSLVRNWDGMELGDAGFSDYPTVEGYTASNGVGSLTSSSTYYFRVYAVRYNKRGERFQSIAVTSTAMTTGASDDTLAITINTVPATNHTDVMLEVYRTEAGGTTFYLDGVADNDLTADTVTYTSTLSDATLRSTRGGDPHAPGIGIQSELEELGPVGCEILVATSDRLWGAGGQVPPGFVQFSKLKEPGEGAGFDPLSGYQQVDTEGGAVTSIVGYAESIIIFEEKKLYQMFGSGPDNYGNGGFSTPQLHLVDGATTHLGTGVTQAGPVFWGADGPRLITPNMTVETIAASVRELSKDLTPTGLQIDLARQEAVWFTADGTAILWNYQSGSRWAQWSSLKIAGACSESLVTTDGRLLIESADAQGDGGAPFAFSGATGELNGGSFGGDMELGFVGLAGVYFGPHNLRMRIFYNGSPLWSEQWIWEPETDTWLASGDDHGTSTPAEIDALKPVNKSGGYATHKKVSRHNCRHFRLEWSDVSALRPTYRPYELTLEVGSRGDLGRVPVNTFRS